MDTAIAFRPLLIFGGNHSFERREMVRISDSLQDIGFSGGALGFQITVLRFWLGPTSRRMPLPKRSQGK
jgi:hypothetical protein